MAHPLLGFSGWGADDGSSLQIILGAASLILGFPDLKARPWARGLCCVAFGLPRLRDMGARQIRVLLILVAGRAKRRESLSGDSTQGMPFGGGSGRKGDAGVCVLWGTSVYSEEGA